MRPQYLPGKGPLAKGLGKTRSHAPVSISANGKWPMAPMGGPRPKASQPAVSAEDAAAGLAAASLLGALADGSSPVPLGNRPDFSAQIALLRASVGGGPSAPPKKAEPPPTSTASLLAAMSGVGKSESSEDSLGGMSPAEMYVMQLVSRAQRGEVLSAEETHFLASLRNVQMGIGTAEQPAADAASQWVETGESPGMTFVPEEAAVPTKLSSTIRGGAFDAQDVRARAAQAVDEAEQIIEKVEAVSELARLPVVAESTLPVMPKSAAAVRAPEAEAPAAQSSSAETPGEPISKEFAKSKSPAPPPLAIDPATSKAPPPAAKPDEMSAALLQNKVNEGLSLNAEEADFLKKLQVEEALKRQRLQQELAEKQAIVKQLSDDTEQKTLDWEDVAKKAELIKQTRMLSEAAKAEEEKKQKEEEEKKVRPKGPAPAFRNSFVMQKAGTPVSTLMKRMYAGGRPGKKNAHIEPELDFRYDDFEEPAKPVDGVAADDAAPKDEASKPEAESKADEGSKAEDASKAEDSAKAGDEKNADDPSKRDDEAGDRKEEASPRGDKKREDSPPLARLRSSSGRRRDDRDEPEGKRRSHQDEREPRAREDRDTRRVQREEREPRGRYREDREPRAGRDDRDAYARGSRRDDDRDEGPPRRSRRDADLDRDLDDRGDRGDNGARRARRSDDLDAPPARSRGQRDRGDVYDDDRPPRRGNRDVPPRRGNRDRDEDFDEPYEPRPRKSRRAEPAVEDVEPPEPRSRRKRAREEVHEEEEPEYDEPPPRSRRRRDRVDDVEELPPPRETREPGTRRFKEKPQVAADDVETGQRHRRERRRDVVEEDAPPAPARRERRRDAAQQEAGAKEDAGQRDRDREAAPRDRRRRAEADELVEAEESGKRRKGKEIPATSSKSKATKDDVGKGKGEAAADDEYYSDTGSEPSEKPLPKRKTGFDNAEPRVSITDAYRADGGGVTLAASGGAAARFATASDGSLLSTRPTASFVTSSGQRRFCMKFLVGQCFETACPMLHATTEAERREGYIKLQQVRSTPCRHGPRCNNMHCMYSHGGTQQPLDASGKLAAGRA